MHVVNQVIYRQQNADGITYLTINMKKIQTIIQTKKFQTAAFALLSLFAVLIIFQAGVVVGYKKAVFSRGLGENYSRAYGDPDHDGDGFFGRIPGDNMTSSHGAVGKIVRITLPTIVVASKDAVEKVIHVSDDTNIRKFRNEMKSTDLVVGDFIVVLGEPNTDSQIEARLIRVLPPPKDAQGTSTPKP